MSSPEHQQAQELAAEAGQLAAAGRRAEAIRLYARAAESEQRALDTLPTDKVRTRGILGVSLAALLYKAGLFDQVEGTVHDLLARDDLLSAAQEQLQAILQVAQQAKAVNGQEMPHVLEADKQPSEMGTA